MDGSTRDGASVPPARDPAFAARYLARDGLSLGAVAEPVPDALPRMAAGAQLAVVLSSVDPRRAHRGDLAEVMLAHCRMACHQFAGLLEAVWEWARSPVADGGTVVRRDEAHRFAGKELAPLLGWTLYHAEQVLTLARLAVSTAPRLLAALRAGRLDEAKLRVLATELAAITDAETVRAVVDAILDGVDTHTTGTLAEHIRRVLGDLDPGAVRKTREVRIGARRMTRREGTGGVTRFVLGCYDAADAAAAYAHVDAIAHATHSCGDDRGRTMDQLRADIALDLLRGVDPTAAGHARPGQRQGVISLTVGLSTLAGLDDEHGVLAGHGPVTAAVARQTAAQFADACQWRFQLHDDSDDGRLITEGRLPRKAVAQLVEHLRAWASTELNRHPVDADAGADGRAHRDPTAAQKAFVRARDRSCQHPGCRVPASRCDIDHRMAWTDGGPTIVANLHALCRTHHRFKHGAGLRYEPGVGGLIWTHPGGRRYLKLGPDLRGYSHSGGAPPHLRQ